MILVKIKHLIVNLVIQYMKLFRLQIFTEAGFFMNILLKIISYQWVIATYFAYGEGRGRFQEFVISRNIFGGQMLVIQKNKRSHLHI